MIVLSYSAFLPSWHPWRGGRSCKSFHPQYIQNGLFPHIILYLINDSPFRPPPPNDSLSFCRSWSQRKNSWITTREFRHLSIWTSTSIWWCVRHGSFDGIYKVLWTHISKFFSMSVFFSSLINAYYWLLFHWTVLQQLYYRGMDIDRVALNETVFSHLIVGSMMALYRRVCF